MSNLAKQLQQVSARATERNTGVAHISRRTALKVADKLIRLESERDDAVCLLERVQDQAESTINQLRDRMTEDEIREFGFQLCGLTAELHWLKPEPTTSKAVTQ